MFLEEVLLQVQEVSPEGYVVASQKLKEMGGSVYNGPQLEKWNNLLEELDVPQRS
jgi:hypothetical protein